MMAARVISGLGFQIALFRAYFADTAPKKSRANKFGLIGVIQGFSLFGGPALGGFVSQIGGKRMAAWLSAFLCVLGAVVACCWRPEGTDHAIAEKAPLTSDSLAAHNGNVKTVG